MARLTKDEKWMLENALHRISEAMEKDRTEDENSEYLYNAGSRFLWALNKEEWHLFRKAYRKFTDCDTNEKE